MRAISGNSGTAAVSMDTTAAQRLLDTYARMAGDADSYVYLAAVQGLASLADALPGWCIPRLVGLFAALPTSTTLYPPHQEAPTAESQTTAVTAAATPLTFSQVRFSVFFGKIRDKDSFKYCVRCVSRF